MKNYVCTYHYEEWKVTTGISLNIGIEVDVEKKLNNNISSYTYSHFSADGIEDEVQLNLHDDAVDKQHELHRLNSDHSMKGNDLTATYQLKRLLACIDSTNIRSDGNEEVPLNCNDSDS